MTVTTHIPANNTLKKSPINAASRNYADRPMQDDTELFKQFSDNEGFHRCLTDTVFGITYSDGAS